MFPVVSGASSLAPGQVVWFQLWMYPSSYCIVSIHVILLPSFMTTTLTSLPVAPCLPDLEERLCIWTSKGKISCFRSLIKVPALGLSMVPEVLKVFLGEKKGGIHYHPWRLTFNIIMEVWKIIFLSTWVISRFHVNLPAATLVFFSQPKEKLRGKVECTGEVMDNMQ